MRRTRIKFCGLTRSIDIEAAVAVGADALGFNCYERSSRFVQPGQLRSLAAAVPAFVTPVLLFVNAEPAVVNAALALVPSAILQFHGDEPAAYCLQFGRPYVRGVPVRHRNAFEDEARLHPGALALLADAPAPGYGGAGRVFDWSILPSAGERHCPLILAGGLNSENVAAAMVAVRPYAVDVASGIESAPGQKDLDRMRQFAAAVRRADDQLSLP